MHLRSYRPDDLAALYALDTVCFDLPFRFSRKLMRRMVEARRAVVRLAFNTPSGSASETLLGFCILHLELGGPAPIGYIVTLDVDPAARRRGVACTLMQEVETAALQAGAQAIELHVFTGNPAAVRLYERLGYAWLHTVESFYGDGLGARVYRKLLSAPKPLSGPGREGRPIEAS